MREITYIGPLHTAFVMSWVAFIGSAVALFTFNVPNLVVSGNGLNTPTLIAMLGMPLYAGVITFIATLFGCWNYNWVARKWGGIKIQLA